MSKVILRLGVSLVGITMFTLDKYLLSDEGVKKEKNAHLKYTQKHQSSFIYKEYYFLYR